MTFRVLGMTLGNPFKKREKGWLMGAIPSFPAENQQENGPNPTSESIGRLPYSLQNTSGMLMDNVQQSGRMKTRNTTCRQAGAGVPSKMSFLHFVRKKRKTTHAF